MILTLWLVSAAGHSTVSCVCWEEWLCWTLGSFLMRMEAGPSYILWYYVSLAGILFLPYFYYVFISEFMGVRMAEKSRIPLLLMSAAFCDQHPGGSSCAGQI